MKTYCLLALSFLALAPATTRAASIDFTGLGKAEVVTVEGVRNVRAWAGELNWLWLSGKPAGWDAAFYSYCVDLLHNVNDPQNVSIVSTADLGLPDYRAEKAAWLFNSYAPTVHGAGGTNAMAAGLQLAIWEVLYDDGASLTGGANFRVTSASSGALSAGGGYLSALAATGTAFRSSSATVLDAPLGFGQDQMVNTPVPEPGTLLLLATGLAAAVTAQRRRTRRGGHSSLG